MTIDEIPAPRRALRPRIPPSRQADRPEAEV